MTLEFSDSYQVNNQERTSILTITKSYFQLFWDNDLVLLILLTLCPQGDTKTLGNLNSGGRLAFVLPWYCLVDPYQDIITNDSWSIESIIHVQA